MDGVTRTTTITITVPGITVHGIGDILTMDGDTPITVGATVATGQDTTMGTGMVTMPAADIIPATTHLMIMDTALTTAPVAAVPVTQTAVTQPEWPIVATDLPPAMMKT